jgi:hypothetical protein
MFALLAGLGILMVALFPLALPGLLLFVVAPLILVLAVGLLLAIPLVPAVWLVGTLRRRRSGRLAWAAAPAAYSQAGDRPGGWYRHLQRHSASS